MKIWRTHYLPHVLHQQLMTLCCKTAIWKKSHSFLSLSLDTLVGVVTICIQKRRTFGHFQYRICNPNSLVPPLEIDLCFTKTTFKIVFSLRLYNLFLDVDALDLRSQGFMVPAVILPSIQPTKNQHKMDTMYSRVASLVRVD